MPGALRGGAFCVWGPKGFGSCWWEGISLNSWEKQRSESGRGYFPWALEELALLGRLLLPHWDSTSYSHLW